MILNDKQIIKLAEEHEMISPFVNKSVANGISHGFIHLVMMQEFLMNLKFLLI